MASPVLLILLSARPTVALFAATGLYTRATLINAGSLLPDLLIGFGIPNALVSRLNERVFRCVVLTLLVLGGGMLLAGN